MSFFHNPRPAQAAKRGAANRTRSSGSDKLVANPDEALAVPGAHEFARRPSSSSP